MNPLYTAQNCEPAYQLRWSLSLFAERPLPAQDCWLATLKSVVERDGVRILETHVRAPATWQFLLSTQPHVSPPEIVKSVKGRLQHTIRATTPQAFRRNFHLASLGEARREVVEEYVAGQLGHHRMADERARALLAEFQLAFADVDLSTPQNSAHGQYNYSLHLVLVNDGRWCDIDRRRLQTSRDMIVNAAKTKVHRLSRLSLLADHLHMTFGCPYESSPEEVALGYMNNIAYAHGMKPMFTASYYVGTIGNYDMNAVRFSRSVAPSTDAGSEESGKGWAPNGLERRQGST